MSSDKSEFEELTQEWCRQHSSLPFIDTFGNSAPIFGIVRITSNAKMTIDKKRYL